MDALWRIADQVLTPAETEQFTTSEAFILGASFYIHDLGMAMAATDDGVARIRASNEYRAAREHLQKAAGLSESRADLLAIRVAVRELHAEHASILATQVIPGLERYLIEKSEVRNAWSHNIGQVAASHHWQLDHIHRALGVKNRAPMPGGTVADLAYVASILRIVDYAHISRERASSLQRALRSEIGADSLLHWEAQANITGPMRQGEYLAYGCTGPQQDIDAWWLFHDMASGLDREIRAVGDYLRERAISTGRFSLQGVNGIEKPERFAQFVQLAGDTAPIDVRVQPDSMERVVELLGGSQLYGSDSLAPIRELIQNARDAIELRNALEKARSVNETKGDILITFDDSTGKQTLSIRDNGVGMTRSTVVNHLIAVASDFWHSADFYRDYGPALESGFSPIGKFGIGFLSVFMLGDYITVITEAHGSNRIQLKLRGIGRRGELRELPPAGVVGTEIHIILKSSVAAILEDLPSIVRCRAPMMSVAMTVQTNKGAISEKKRIEPGWWQHVDHDDLRAFIQHWDSISFRGKEDRSPDPHQHRMFFTSHSTNFGDKYTLRGWPGLRPTICNETQRLMSEGGRNSFGVIRCSKGVAVDHVPVADLTGLVEVGELPLTAARSAMYADLPYGRIRMAPAEWESRLIYDIQADVIAKLNDLERYGMISARLGFLRGLALVYGREVLLETTLPWIPVIEPPGNLIHQSKTDLTERLRTEERLMIASGVGPSSAYAAAAPWIAESELGKIPIVAIRFEEISVPYTVQNELKVKKRGSTISGTLTDLTSPHNKFEIKLTLIPIVIAIVAEAWGVSIDSLERQTWRLEHESSILWTDLTRKGHGLSGRV
ncbi:MAG: ATP-binding protein [Acidobacteriota bacterium]